MPAGRVDCSLFTANNKVIDISGWEGHSCNRHWFGLVVHQLHALLSKQGIIPLFHYSLLFHSSRFLWLFFSLIYLFIFSNSVLNVKQSSRKGRRNCLTHSHDFGVCTGRGKKMQCLKRGCSASAIPAAVCHVFQSSCNALVFATSS